jgi:phage shock protein A
MSILDRIGDLISANVNDLLEKAEDPEKMANEYLRQLNHYYYETKDDVASAMAQEKRLQDKMLDAQAEAEKYRRHAENALRSNQEDLARRALERKRQALKLAGQYEEQFKQQDAQVDELEEALAAIEARMAQMQAKRDALAAKRSRIETHESIRRTARTLSNTSAVDKMETLEDRVEGQLAKSEAMAELEAGSVDKQLEDLTQDSEIDSELLEMKKQLGLA